MLFGLKNIYLQSSSDDQLSKEKNALLLAKKKWAASRLVAYIKMRKARKKFLEVQKCSKFIKIFDIWKIKYM